MLNKVFIAAAAAMFLGGAALIAQPAPAMAHGFGCWKAAKAQFPGDFRGRWAYWKACKRAHKGGGLFAAK